jgi:hypothetical protein
MVLGLGNALIITANGPAIWGGCVTRRSIRAGPWYPAPAGPEKCQGVMELYFEQMRALPAVASAKAGIRVQQQLRNCLGCRTKS